jgi:hypothetical protein
MLYNRLRYAISHPETLSHWSAWMKPSGKTKQTQIELFCQTDQTNDPVLTDLPMERRVELEKALANLLLNVAVGNARVVAGGVHDDA